ncbi:THO complex subunit 1 [Malaya genurostris]|uniref:THO complex subunit 1 n=1 Tax=Malaya genurostris TaxID=325434 RepID=UPI0026F401BF|nr:THO complex subunit 1 [Malaya genurostris]
MTSSNFLTLLKVFTEIVNKSFKTGNIEHLKAEYDAQVGSSDNDRKAALHQAFRDLLLTKTCDIPAIEDFINFAVAACRQEMTSPTIPVVLLGDIFDAVTLDKCEQIFTYVENNVATWKEEFFFAACKHNLLRMCNDLLRRLSRSQNTVFCGRILLFLAKFFPFSERSGLNIISEFNLENITEYGVEGSEMGDQLGSSEENATGNQLKIDYNLYCKFWALQDFFRNPNQCYNKVQWKMFAAHAGSVMSAFSSFKLEEPRSAPSSSSSSSSSGGASRSVPMEIPLEEQVRETGHFFAKFLTNPKLLSLQLSDSNFRRSVLVQLLILFQYLNSTVKFKADNHCLTTAQVDWLKETEVRVYKLIEESPPNGRKFADSVRHMLSREELWNSWKNEGCKEFKRPDAGGPGGTNSSSTGATAATGGSNGEEATPPMPIRVAMKRPRRALGDLIQDSTKQGKFFMGNPELTRLWNTCPDNLLACKGEDRNFLPSLEAYLDGSKEKHDPSVEWRALRLLARQSPHFFTLFNSPSYKVADYLESVRKKIQKDKIDVQREVVQEDTPMHPEQGETEGEGFGAEEETDQMDSELLKTEQLTPEDKNTHKTITVTLDQMAELAPSIGKDWKKLATKLGYGSDEIQYCESENATVTDQCRHLLQVWFEDDMDASLDQLAYILEGLDLLVAADAVKQMISALTGDDKVEEISD